MKNLISSWFPNAHFTTFTRLSLFHQENYSGSKGPLLKVYKNHHSHLSGVVEENTYRCGFIIRLTEVKSARPQRACCTLPQKSSCSLCPGCTHRANQLNDMKTFPSGCFTFQRNQFPELVTRLPACQCQHPGGGRKVELPAMVQD